MIVPKSTTTNLTEKTDLPKNIFQKKQTPSREKKFYQIHEHQAAVPSPLIAANA